jgi:hypothetical protein
MTPLTYKRWLSGVALAAFIFAALFLAVIVKVDVYGIFRDSQGRRLPIYVNERASKYLLNRRYVPTNFDSVLIGSSTTSNWETNKIENLKIYNNSVDGGDTSEEQLLMQQSAGKHYKVALVLLHPYFTCMHTINDPDMNAKGLREAFGSFNLLLTYRQMYRVNRLHLKPLVFWDGHKALNEKPILPSQKALEYIYKVDPQALAAYQSLLQEIRSNGTKVIFVIPPMYDPLLKVNRPLLDEYRRQIHIEQSGEQVIDFNVDAFAAIRQDRDNFSDGIHSTTKGAALIVQALNHSLLAMQGIESADRNAPASR